MRRGGWSRDKKKSQQKGKRGGGEGRKQQKRQRRWECLIMLMFVFICFLFFEVRGFFKSLCETFESFLHKLKTFRSACFFCRSVNKLKMMN